MNKTERATMERLKACLLELTGEVEINGGDEGSFAGPTNKARRAMVKKARAAIARAERSLRKMSQFEEEVKAMTRKLGPPDEIPAWPEFLDSKEFFDRMTVYRAITEREKHEALDQVRFFIRDAIHDLIAASQGVLRGNGFANEYTQAQGEKLEDALASLRERGEK